MHFRRTRIKIEEDIPYDAFIIVLKNDHHQIEQATSMNER
jgi:hypothetical protein